MVHFEAVPLEGLGALSESRYDRLIGPSLRSRDRQGWCRTERASGCSHHGASGRSGRDLQFTKKAFARRELERVQHQLEPQGFGRR